MNVDTTSENPTHMTNSKGHAVPIAMVDEKDKLQDQAVREIYTYATALMSQIARFRAHSCDDLNSLMGLLSEQYGYSYRGKKGNVSFVTFDGLIKVEVKVRDYIAFGPELQIAKGLIDEYIDEVGDKAPDEIKTLLTLAFETDKPGKVNTSALYAMRRWPIQHPKWTSAMTALTDSMRVLESKEHFIVSTRDNARDGWRALPINLANAYEVAE